LRKLADVVTGGPYFRAWPSAQYHRANLLVRKLTERFDDAIDKLPRKSIPFARIVQNDGADRIFDRGLNK
jgi:hypothetical protein